MTKKKGEKEDKGKKMKGAKRIFLCVVAGIIAVIALFYLFLLITA